MTADETPSTSRLDAPSTPLTISGGTRQPLRQLGGTCFLDSGRLEVYYSESDSADLDQRRRFLFEIRAGEILPDLRPIESELSIDLFAVGWDALLRPITSQQFADWIAREDRLAVDAVLARWLTHVVSRMHAEPPPRAYELPVGQVVTLPTSDAVRPSAPLCWVTAVDGRCHMNGQPFLEVTGHVVIPVSADMWLQSAGPQTSVRTMTTEELQSSGNLPEALTSFSGQVFHVIVAHDRRASQAERERLRQRDDVDNQLLGRSFDTLGSVLDKSGRRATSSGAGPSDPLLEAARVVGQAVGVEIDGVPDAGSARSVQVRDVVETLSRASRVRSRKVALRGDWWRRNHGPLLAFLADENQPVALLPLGSTRYEMHDPTRNSITTVTADIAVGIRPMAYMFFPTFGESKLTPAVLWKLGLRGVWGDLRFVILASAVGGLMALTTPIVSKVLFDDIVPQADRGQLPVVAIILAVFALVSASLGLVRGLVLLRLEAKMELNMEAALMDRLLRLPAAFFKDFLAGDLAQRILGIASIRAALTGTTLTAILSGVFSVISLGLLVYYDMKLAALGVVLAIIAVGVILASSLVALRYNRKLAEIAGEISGLVLQLMSGVPKLRTAAAEQRAFSVWAGRFAQQSRQSFRAGAIQNNFEIFQSAYPLLTSILFFATIYVIAERAAALQISTGTFIAVISAFAQFLGGMLGLGGAVISVLHVVPQYERMKPIFEATSEISHERVDPGRLSGDIEITNLTFRYAEDGPVILNDITFNAHAGEMIALVGPSGSGKSTLVRLLLGFEQPEAGAIFYDGKDLTGLDLEAVRQQFGVVLQHGQLVSGDILSNIVGPWDLALDDAWVAARMVGLHEDIQAMPMGMHTIVNEDGGTFSGGQKQRLLIARAIVHQPAVLLLDEATSALDNRTQRIVSESLKAMNVTRVVIAHRLSTIQEADRIYVVEAGRIIESGTYESLVAAGGQFSTLAKRQML